MRHALRLFLISVAVVAVIGCAPSEPATPESNNTSSPPANNTAATAEKGKCDFCGAEVAKSELTAHDGKMACAKCIASHNH
jgi:hypothetical protein